MPDNQSNAASVPSGALGTCESDHRIRIAASEVRAAFMVSRLEAYDVEAYGDLTVPDN